MKIPSDNCSTTRKIICCSVCEGSGTRDCQELVDYHKNEYEYWREYCSFCGGEGRVLEYTYKYRLDVELPNGESQVKWVEYTRQKTLEGLKTSDIYKIGAKFRY